MLWNKRNNEEQEIPPELQGKSPQDILAMLNDAKALKTQLDESIAAHTASKAEMDQLKVQQAETTKLIESLKANQKPPDPTPQEPASIWTDPDKYIDEKTMGTQSLALMSGIMSAKMYARQSLDPADAKIFTKYEKEINDIMNTYQPAMRVIPDNWVNALTFVKGKHYQEVAKMQDTSSNEFFAEGASGGAPPKQEPTDRLTPDEEAVCKAMHWDPKRYLESRRKRTIVQGDKGSYATFTRE